ncbi:MAG: bifunctional ornithine acetyltransferase/N-acetylglutamate synthase, partial [Verrucomicrobiota bacterium]
MKTTQFTKITGSVTAARGFRAAGLSAGIKKSGKKDMALIMSDVPATVAGVFTRNQVKAAPVKLDM